MAIAVNSSGAVATRTVVLLTPEEVDRAVKRSMEYRAPGAWEVDTNRFHEAGAARGARSPASEAVPKERHAPYQRCTAAGPEIVSVDHNRDKSQQSTTINARAECGFHQ